MPSYLRYYRTYIMGNEHGELPHFACHGMLVRTRRVQQVLAAAKKRLQRERERERERESDIYIYIYVWVWLKIKRSEGPTAGSGLCFHLPGPAILELFPRMARHSCASFFQRA